MSKTLTLDKRIFCAVVDDNPIELTRMEWELLNYLYDNKDKVCSKPEILDAVWSGDCTITENTVEVYVGYLRSKLGKEYIKTRRGFGYQLVI